MIVKSLSCVRLFVTPWTVAHQAPPSMGLSRQEYWSGLPFPSPGDLPDPGIEPSSPALQADILTSEPPGKPCFSLPPLKWVGGSDPGKGDLCRLELSLGRLSQDRDWGRGRVWKVHLSHTKRCPASLSCTSNKGHILVLTLMLYFITALFQHLE